MKQLVLLITIICCTTACGKRGALLPPEALVPAAINDLRTEQHGEAFRLSWSIPDKTAGGGKLRNLAVFRIFKREVLPPAEDCEACPTAYQLFKTVDLAYLQDARRLGNYLFITDTEVTTGKTYRYKAVAVSGDSATSGASNRADRKKVPAPLPPALQAHFALTDVTLEFVALPFPPESPAIGFNIFRWQDNEPFPLSAINDQPVTGNTYRDTGLIPGEHYHYAVTILRSVGAERVESPPSNEVDGHLTESP